MSKFSDNFKRFKWHYIIAGLIAFLLGSLAFLLFFFLVDKDMISAINGVTISAVSLLAIGGFIWLSSQGTFDLLAYGFKQMFTSMFNKNANKYHDYADYHEQKNIARVSMPKTYFSFLFVGLLFGIALAVLEIIYHAGH